MLCYTVTLCEQIKKIFLVCIHGTNLLCVQEATVWEWQISSSCSCWWTFWNGSESRRAGSLWPCAFSCFFSASSTGEKHIDPPWFRTLQLYTNTLSFTDYGGRFLHCDVSNSAVGCSERNAIQTALTCFPQHAVIWLHSYHTCLSTYRSTVFLFQCRQCPDSGLMLLSCEDVDKNVSWVRGS